MASSCHSPTDHRSPTAQRLSRGLWSVVGQHQRVRLALAFAFFLLYAVTTARDILPADSGEFQVAVAGWGILHPPGYPLYTVLGALWVRLLPVGALTFRLNLFSAALAALTLLLVGDAVRVWAHPLCLPERAAALGSVAAMLLLGLSPTFWAQATTANIRIPTLLFGAWGFLALGCYANTQSLRALLSLALALGLGVGHHPSLIFIAASWALYLLLTDPRLFIQPRRWRRAALVGAAAWLLPQFYIPLRGGMANVPLADPGLNTWGGFWHHVLAQGFSGDMLAFANAPDLALRLPLIPALYTFQFAPFWLLAIGIGWAWLLRRHAPLALSLLVGWMLHTFITITYRAPQTVEYLMPAYLPLLLVLGLAMAGLEAGCSNLVAGSCEQEVFFRGVSQKLRVLCGKTPLSKIQNLKSKIFTGALLLFLLTPLPMRLPDFLALAADTSIRDRVAPLLEAAPPGALILADWHWATPLWVLQDVEGLGAGVDVAYVYPEPPLEYEAVWLARAEAAGARPVFSTHAHAWPGWTAAPVGGGYRLYRQPLDALDSALGFTPLEAELGPVRVLGFKAVGPRTPGSVLEVQLAWQASGPQSPAPSFAGRLWGADGALLAAGDRYLGEDAVVGEVRFARLDLLLPLDVCQAVAELRVGVYTVSESGFQDLGDTALASLPLDCRYPRLPSEHPALGFAPGGPFLRGYDYDVDGERATLYLHWCGPGAALVAHSEGQTALIGPLGWGRCQSVRLPVGAGAPLALQFTRLDGRRVQMWSTGIPAPPPVSRYIPFADRMMLTGITQRERGGQTVMDMRWRVIRPLVEDYAVSVRLLGADGALLAAHDFQPALSTIPTLKWVTRDGRILDPHPFAGLETMPAALDVSVYERFRLIPLPSTRGEPARVGLNAP